MSERSVRVVLGPTNYTVTAGNGVHEWKADEQAAAGGADAGPTPTGLVLSGLGACTAITLRMYAARKQWDLQHVEVVVDINPAGKPADGSNSIRRKILVQGKLDDEQRARLLQIANACPVHKLLTGTIHIESELDVG